MGYLIAEIQYLRYRMDEVYHDYVAKCASVLNVYAVVCARQLLLMWY